MKKAKFLVAHFEAGLAKFNPGEVHDLTDETRLCIARGAAVEVDVPDEKPPKTKPGGDGAQAGGQPPAGEGQPSTDGKTAAKS